MNKLIAIDAGHTLLASGRRTPPLRNGKHKGRQVKEAEFNFALSYKLKEELERCGFRTLLVAEDEKSGKKHGKEGTLRRRVNKANRAHADIYISLHYNANRGYWWNGGGIDTFYYKTSKLGKKLAKLVQNEVSAAAKKYKVKNRGVKKCKFYVTKYTDMPAILVEHGFMDSTIDAYLMLNEQYQRDLAIAEAKAICKYFKVKYVPAPKKCAKKELYRVQIGSYSDKHNAEKLAEELAKKGYTPFITKG